MEKKEVTIVGCGNMGGAILTTISDVEKFSVTGIEKDEEKVNRLKEGLGLRVLSSLEEAAKSRIYIVAVKPQDIDGALKAIGEVMNDIDGKVLVISIAAGIKIGYIKESLRDHAEKLSVVRVMPNTPALVKKGMSVISVDRNASDEEIEIVEEIFGNMGEALRLGEEHMDTVTALSGSGPAYFFHMAEIMQRFAVDNGIEAETASKLILQTIKGAGELMSQSYKSFKQLKEDVTSPGGTTEAALKHLNSTSASGPFSELYFEALQAAKARSKVLSER